MIRDFTESTLDELKEIAEGAMDEYFGFSEGDTYHGMLEHTTTVAGENCVVDLSSIQEEAEMLLCLQEEGDTLLEQYMNKLERIFSDARDRDTESLSTVDSRINDAYTPYIESMQQLAECIDVSALGDDYASFNYNRGYYHSTFNSSVYGEPDSFKQKVDAVEGGACDRYYESINDYMDDEEELERLQEKLHSNPEDLEPWEEDALLMLMNDCIEYDADGNLVVNYEKVSVFLSNCYDEEEYSIAAGFRSYTIYTTTPMFDYLAEQYDGFYNVLSSSYGSMDDNLAPFADLNSIFTATSVYYHEVHCDSTIDYAAVDENTVGWPTIPFGITVSEEYVEVNGVERNYIVIDLNQNDSDEFHIDLNPFSFATEETLYHDWEHNIYISPASQTLSLSDGMAMATENGTIDVKDALTNYALGNLDSTIKDNTVGKITGAITEKIPIAGTALKIYKKVKGYYDVVQNTEAANAEIEADALQLTEIGYLEDLGVGGNYCVCGTENAMATSLTPNYNLVSVRVAYYNQQENKDLTTDELIDSFNAAISGDEAGGQSMEEFHNARTYVTESDYAVFNGYAVSEDDYVAQVRVYVTDTYGVSLENASSDQLQAAIDYVSENYVGDTGN